MTMEKKIKKIIAFMMTALLSVMVLTACSSSDSPKSSADDSNTTASQTLTKDEYVEKVKSLSTEISEVTAKYSTDMQSTATMADATKKLIGEIKPIYEELGNLNAPEEFASQQEKIKSGCTASVETLDLSLELIQLGLGETQASAEDLTAKMTELNSKITELSSQAQGLTTALQEVMAS